MSSALRVSVGTRFPLTLFDLHCHVVTVSITALFTRFRSLPSASFLQLRLYCLLYDLS